MSSQFSSYFVASVSGMGSNPSELKGAVKGLRQLTPVLLLVLSDVMASIDVRLQMMICMW